MNNSKRNYNYIILTIAIFAAYTIFGFSDSAKGVALPRIQAEFKITELQIGLLLTMNIIGYIIACSYTAALARKIGIKASMIAALSVIAGSGIFMSFSSSFVTLVSAFFILNLGFGMLEISLGVIAATTFTKNTGTMLNLSHFFYGAGAVISPIVSIRLMTAHVGEHVLGWRYMYPIILSSALIPAVPALISHFKKQDDKKKTGYAALLKKPALWLTVMILALGGICEIGTGAWLVNFLEKAFSFSSEKAALHLTLFFVCFTLARLVLGPIIDRIGLINALVIVTAFAGVMITVGVLCGEAGSPLLVIAGIGIAPVFPTVMAVTAKLFSDEIDLAISAIITIMSIIIVPANLLLGGIIQQARILFANKYGEAGEVGIRYAYSVGYLFLGLCCFGSFAFALLLRKKQKKAGQLV